ncbi:MAG: hypothetical protein GY856_05745, partial [bacterium]|nr:hypothetical protein [bacterium]
MAATLRHLERAVRDLMPPGVTRDFYGWALEPANPLREEFLASAGICQLTHMNTVLLDGLVDGVDLGNLTDRLGLMAAWQYFEVISDNLAIGLARRPPGDLNCNQRRRLVGRFNAAVIRRLQGDRAGAAEQLRALASGVGRISLFDQSLTAGKARRFAAAFASDGDGTVEELEQDVVPVLIVNMELVAECADRVRDPDLRAVTVAGLIARYAAVDRQLAGSARTPAEL